MELVAGVEETSIVLEVNTGLLMVVQGFGVFGWEVTEKGTNGWLN